MRKILVPAIAIVILLGLQPLLPAQAQPGRGQAAPPPAARAAAPWDVTGYWVALVTDDWRYRMLTPPKGNVDYIPVTAEARRVADQWDPAKDEVAGEQCKGYGAGGIMRLPVRLHIAWEDDNTLKMDIDMGTQTRRFGFAAAPAAAAADKATWQGNSMAHWDLPGPGGQGPGGVFFASSAAPAPAPVGQLRVVTTGMRPGYVRKNGVPYGVSAVVTEYFVHLVDTDGQEYLAVTTMVDDAKFFQVPYIKTYEFKKQPDAKGWNPTPCSAK